VVASGFSRGVTPRELTGPEVCFQRPSYLGREAFDLLFRLDMEGGGSWVVVRAAVDTADGSAVGTWCPAISEGGSAFAASPGEGSPKRDRGGRPRQKRDHAGCRVVTWRAVVAPCESSGARGADRKLKRPASQVAQVPLSVRVEERLIGLTEFGGVALSKIGEYARRVTGVGFSPRQPGSNLGQYGGNRAPKLAGPRRPSLLHRIGPLCHAYDGRAERIVDVLVRHPDVEEKVKRAKRTLGL